MVTGPPCKRVFARSNRAPATFSSRGRWTAPAKRLLPVGPRASEDGSDRSPLHGKAQIGAHGLPIASGRSFRGGFAPMERGAGTSGMRGGILLVRCLKHLAPVRAVVDRRIVFGTGTVVSRMAHHYNGHHGTFEACPTCQWEPAARWEQGASFGVLVTDGPRVVEVSETARSSWCRSGGVSD